MKISQQHSNAAADDQAARWAARLEGGVLPAADRAELDAWLAENAHHRALLSNYCQFSADLEQVLPALVEAGAVTMPAKKTPARRAGNLPWILTGALAVAAAVALVFWVARPAAVAQNIATAVAQRQTITLADGTRVELNARTTLVVEKGGAARGVRLVEGEALFFVSKDKSRPFIVETPAGSVRVTGTTFDVRTESAAELEVTVIEGSVQVRPGEAGNGSASAPIALMAGDKLTAGNQGVSVRKLPAAELEDALAWRQGVAMFHDVPLREALARFSRYHGRRITVTPAAASAGLSVGGRYSLDDLDGFFVGLEQALPVRVSRDLDGTVRISLRDEH